MILLMKFIAFNIQIKEEKNVWLMWILYEKSGNWILQTDEGNGINKNSGFSF